MSSFRSKRSDDAQYAVIESLEKNSKILELLFDELKVRTCAFYVHNKYCRKHAMYTPGI